MLQFTPTYFSSDEPNSAKKNCSCERALTVSLLVLIAQPASVHYNRGVSSLKPVSEQVAKTLITLEPNGIF